MGLCYLLPHIIQVDQRVVTVAPPKPDRVPEHVRGKLREEAWDEVFARAAAGAHAHWRQSAASREQYAEHVQTDPGFVEVPRPRARRANVCDEFRSLCVVPI